MLISYSGPLIIFSRQRSKPRFPRHDDFMDLGISIGAALAGIFYRLNTKYLLSPPGLRPERHYWSRCFPIFRLNEAVAAYITSAVVIFSHWDYRLFRQIAVLDSPGSRRNDGRNFTAVWFDCSPRPIPCPISSLACWRCFCWLLFQSTLCHGLGAGCRCDLSMLLGKINPVTADFSLAIPQFIAPEWT